MPDNFLDHASQNEQLAQAGLDEHGLIKVIREMCSLSNLNNEIEVS